MEFICLPLNQGANSTDNADMSSIERSTIDDLTSLNTDDSDDLVCELITLFLKQTPTDLVNIRKGVTTSDTKLVMSEAHRLKSASANLGAKQLSAICMQLEEMGRTANLTGAANLVGSLENEYLKVKIELEAIEAERKGK